MKSNQLKLFMMILVVFSYTFFLYAEKTKAIYAEVKSTSISLSVGDCVATTNGVCKSTLADAVNAVKNNPNPSTIVILKDIELDEHVSILRYQNIALDLNGHTISNSASFSDNNTPCVIRNYGLLEIKDTSVGGTGAIYNTNDVRLLDNQGGTLTITNGEVQSASFTVGKFTVDYDKATGKATARQ